MYAVNCVNNIDSLDILARSKKRIFGCIGRLNIFDNSIMKCINNSWILKFDICSVWNELLYTQCRRVSRNSQEGGPSSETSRENDNFD